MRIALSTPENSEFVQSQGSMPVCEISFLSQQWSGYAVLRLPRSEISKEVSSIDHVIYQLN